jgi:hypothetical protein
VAYKNMPLTHGNLEKRRLRKPGENEKFIRRNSSDRQKGVKAFPNNFIDPQFLLFST